MEITRIRKNDISILELNGELNVITSKLLEENMMELIDAGEKKLMADFSCLDYISSSGLRVFLLALKALNRTGGKIVLTSMQDHIQEAFNVTGFTDLFSIYPSQENAINDFQ